jgi:hypothetical protein
MAAALLVAGVSLLGAVPATAAGATWYAYPSGTSSSPTSCPETATPADECSLTQALSDAATGDTVALAISGVEGDAATYYAGNFTVSSGTSTSPLTIAPASGVTDPILDGNLGSSSGCPTTTCNGPVLSIDSSVYATIESITIQDADSAAGGGGVYNSGIATLTDDVISDNSAGYGGGVAGPGTTDLSDDTISGNSASNGGGVDVSGGTDTLTDDTITGNSAKYGGGVNNNGTVTLTNDTISDNSATGAGGALNNLVTAALTDDTLADDTAVNGGGIENGSGTTSVSDSILDGAPCSGTIADGGYNVESDDSCGFELDAVVKSSTINLATALAANGSSGPETLAIGIDSSAFEEVPAAACTITNDERGDPRPGTAGADCDAGAFEPTAGTVTGTITDGSSPPNGLSGICVEADISGPTRVASTVTGTDGTYTLTGLSGGTDYLIQFNTPACGPGGVNPEYYSNGVYYDSGASDGTTAVADATPVMTLSSGVSVALTAASIMGTVSDSSGTPLAGVCVEADTLGLTRVASMVTGTDGTYTLTSLFPGDGYVIQFNTTACGPGGVNPEYYSGYYDSGAANGTTTTAPDASAVTASDTGVDVALVQAASTTPTISNLPAAGAYGGGFTATVSTNGNGTKSVTSNSTSVCTASGLAVSYVGVGTCSLTAHVATGTNYAAADGSAQTFSVDRASQTITFTAPSGGSVNAAASLSPTASSDLTVTLSVDHATTNNACSVSEGTVHYIHAGSCVIDANQAGGTDYLAAAQVQRTISVGKGATTTALKPSATKVTYGHEQTEHLSVTVSPQFPGSLPAGTITVKASTATLCAITLSSGKGSCTLSAERLNAGTYHLVATYAGNTNFKSSTSTKETLAVVK